MIHKFSDFKIILWWKKKRIVIFRRFNTEKDGIIEILNEIFQKNSGWNTNQYKKIIFEEIREVCRDKKIKLIHLCISSSVAFTFALGQGFSKNYDPEVIIYNYEKQEYAWGLKLFERSENSIIIPQKSLK